MVEQYLQFAIQFIKELWFQLNTMFGPEESQAFKSLKSYLSLAQDNPVHMAIAIAIMAFLYSLYKSVSISRKRENKLNERENELDDRLSKLSEHEKKIQQKLIKREIILRDRENKFKKRENKFKKREKNIQEHENKLKKDKNEIDELDNKLSARENELDELENKLRDRENKLSSRENELDELENKPSDSENELNEFWKKLNGLMYKKEDDEKERVVEQDDNELNDFRWHEKAIEFYKIAAEQGDVNAQYILGDAYKERQDEEEAFKWYKISAEQGNTKAQYNLGWFYANGIGIEQDDEQAVQWYKKAAEQGHANAQYNLNEMYVDLDKMYDEGTVVEQGESRASETIVKAQEADEKILFFERSNEEIAALKKSVQEKNIKHLIHFTRYENLESILKNGIMTKDSLNTLGLEFFENDRARFDGYENSISLSVSSPHYVMFYKHRKNFKDAKGWVVIDINPEVLWKYNCAFCKTNAAASRISKRNIDDLYSTKSFEEMFLDIDGGPFWHTDDGARGGLDPYHTTDLQAEVLVFNNIPAKHIQTIYFENEELLEIAESKYNKDVANNINFVMEKIFFEYDRVYWEC